MFCQVKMMGGVAPDCLGVFTAALTDEVQAGLGAGRGRPDHTGSLRPARQ